MRSFAQYIGVSSPRLSDILNKKKGLSKDKALLIAEKLGLNVKDSEYFGLLVESEHARKKSTREVARLKLQSFYEEKLELSFEFNLDPNQATTMGNELKPMVEKLIKKYGSSGSNGKHYRIKIQLHRR